MKILETAKQLGEMIKDTQEYQRFLKAQTEIQSDEAAIALLQDFDKIRHEYSQVVASNDVNIVNEVTEKIKAKEEELKANPTANEFIEASANYSNVIKSVNDMITATISGQAAHGGCGTEQSGCGSEESGCGSSCGSCGC